MIQNAILKFVRADKVTPGVIKISTGENVATHVGTVANDFSGADTGKDYMLAPFDCVVKAIRKYDNQVLFESTCQVNTARLGIQDHVCFTATHMYDADFKALGIYVGKEFKQGEIIYREGNKGISGGNHIHMSQAIGKYNGGITSVVTGSTYKYQGKTYKQYRINAGTEAHVYDVFFAGSPVVHGLSDSAKKYSWLPVPKEVPVVQDSTQDNVEDTLKFKCVKYTIKPNRYPTRKAYNGSFDNKSYFINVGDIVVVDDMKKHHGNTVYRIADCITNGVSSKVLNGRWFMFDKNYFREQ